MSSRFVHVADLSREDRDAYYHSDANWVSPLSDEDHRNLERHRLLIGPLIRGDRQANGQPFDPEKTAREVRFHWSRLSQRGRERFQGAGALAVLRGMYMALVFGQNCFVEGGSGTAKTQVMLFLRKLMQAPVAEFNASADATDLSLLGGALPGEGLRFQFQRGPVTKPGALGLMVDELPRLPVQTSNVLLFAMATRQTTLSLVACGKTDHTLALSPNFFVLGVGNPPGYGGQAFERSQALWDRFALGLQMPQPPSHQRLEMYHKELNNEFPDLMAPETEKAEQMEQPELPEFTFREAHAAMRRVTIPDALLMRTVAASFAVTPRAFRQLAGWSECGFYEDHVRKLGRRERGLLTRLTELVEDHLLEGSNPRGELALIKNARALCLIDYQVLERTEPAWEAQPRHLAEAFALANRTRLKTVPGDEDKVELILQQARAVFFPDEHPEGGAKHATGSAR